MNLHRLVFAIVIAGYGLLRPEPLAADDLGSPFAANTQYSADMVITTGQGQTITQKIYSDTGKVRTEMNASGMQMVSIVRPDLKKVFTVMESQKMVMEMPFDPAAYKGPVGASTAPQGKFDLVGPDTVEGTTCTKYKMTGSDGKIFFYWVAADKTPAKMMAEDNSVTILWKNYKVGPQEASLFVPPADYRTMAMPGGMGGHMPGGPAQ
jgi:hypothetical protein